MIARICAYEDLPEWVDKENLPDNGCGKEWASYILIEDGDYKRVYSEAMEPEDKTFGRDLDWIVDEINRLKP